jgi:hypothetical protein
MKKFFIGVATLMTLGGLALMLVTAGASDCGNIDTYQILVQGIMGLAIFGGGICLLNLFGGECE